MSGDYIKDLIAKSGKSQRAFADLMGVSSSTVNRWTKGEKPGKKYRNMLLRMANDPTAFQAPPDDPFSPRKLRDAMQYVQECARHLGMRATITMTAEDEHG